MVKKEDQIRILIVEDEFITIAMLSTVLKEMNYAISGDAMSANEAIKVLEKGETDFAILDINIKGEKDGIWLAKQIREKYNIPFIFLSAFGDESTVHRAIETEPHGYLVKPFTEVDIFTAIKVALMNFAKQSGATSPEKPENLKEDLSVIIAKDSIFIRDAYMYVKLNTEEILFVKSDKNYLEIHLPKKKHLVRGKMSDFIQNLPREAFVQVHRSYVANLNAIEGIGGGFIKIKSHEIPLSPNYKEELIKRIRLF